MLEIKPYNRSNRRTNQIIDNTPDLIRDGLVIERVVGEYLMNWDLRSHKKLRFALVAGWANGQTRAVFRSCGKTDHQ